MKNGTRKLESNAIEVENVEYLDDCVIHDVVAANEVSDPQLPSKAVTLFEDNFYPNAVQCLISLYRHKYEEEMHDEHEMQNLRENIWKDISKSMRESYFEFDVDQVRIKFTHLRSQYFSIASRSEAEKFEYFHHFHEIYKDRSIVSILRGGSTNKNNSSPTYCDDGIFSLPYETDCHRDIVKIESKKYDLMSIVTNNQKAICDGASNKRNSKEDSLTCALKRSKIDSTSFCSIKHGYPESSLLSQPKSKPEIGNEKQGEMTLSTYNEEQQRRHEEKMKILQQALLLQERAIDVQNKLLEEIIKRI